MSKGMKGEKNMKKITMKALESEKNRIYEGALEIGRNVRALFTDNIYEIAKIIDCRLPPENEGKKKKTDSSYEYYVHYIDFNRRMDQWVTRDMIKTVKPC